MADYSFFDENFDFYLPDGGFGGFPTDFNIPDIDVSSVDLGSILDSIPRFELPDLSLLENFGFGDLSGIGSLDLSKIDLSGISNFGADVGLDTSFDPFEVDGFQGSRTEGNILNSLGVETDPYGVDGLQGSRTEDTALSSLGVETDPYGVDGLQGSRTEDTALTGTTGTSGTNTIKDILKTVTQFAGNKDNALLMALLGGLLGLLSRGSAPKGPVGYKGDIPKYTATRGTPTAPTAGGRRPGGAGIPSLTGGVTYQRAAQGGLMGMAAGGRPARYLRGGTDGMADKIKTDIDGKQPARLSHGEFVIPADVVSHLGNGNSDAGADVLYDMMDKIRKARTGTTKQGKQINPRKYIPA